jgi:hypothetical protein
MRARRPQGDGYIFERTIPYFTTSAEFFSCQMKQFLIDSHTWAGFWGDSGFNFVSL